MLFWLSKVLNLHIYLLFDIRAITYFHVMNDIIKTFLTMQKILPKVRMQVSDATVMISFSSVILKAGYLGGKSSSSHAYLFSAPRT